MDILTLKSKDKLACEDCNKCCIYRGDIRLTPINVCNISMLLKISIKEFLKTYTDRLENDKPEIVLKTVGDLKECIFYDKKINGCIIHKIKPMQCVMFPLIPENIEKDYFYNSGQCVLENAKPVSVNKWLNGNGNIYKKNKDICLEWIKFIEWIQPQIHDFSEEKLEEIYKILFENYNLKKWNLKKQMRKNIKTVIEIVNKNS